MNADGVKAVLSFLNTYAETKVISSPRTVTLDNETSIIEVGTQYPSSTRPPAPPTPPGVRKSPTRT